jgi:hypothetical protein
VMARRQRLRRVIVKIKIKTPTGFHQMDDEIMQLLQS